MGLDVALNLTAFAKMAERAGAPDVAERYRIAADVIRKQAAELDRLRDSLREVTDFAVEYAGGVHSDLGDVEQWDAIKNARGLLTSAAA
jgi:rubrerythrin